MRVLLLSLALMPSVAIGQAMIDGELDRGVACTGRLASQGVEQVISNGGDCAFVTGFCMALGMDSTATIPQSCLLVLQQLAKTPDVKPFERGRIAARLKLDFPNGIAITETVPTTQAAETTSTLTETTTKVDANAPTVKVAEFELPETAPKNQFKTGSSVKGICRITDGAGGDILDEEACFKRVADCKKINDTCQLEFRWPSGSRTVIKSVNARADGGTTINGKKAGMGENMSKAITETDPQECLMNLTSQKVFCFSSTGF